MRYLFPGLLLAASLAACSEHTPDAPTATTEPATSVVSDSLLARITLDTVQQRPVINELKLTAKIAYDESRVNKVFPLVGGIVTKVNVTLGQYVKAGQVLAEIESTDIANFRSESTTATVELAKTRQELASTKELYEDGLASAREYQLAQQEVRRAQAEVQKNRQIGAIYGTQQGGAARYLVKAPAAGFVVEKTVNPRTQLRSDNDQTMFVISDLNTVWALASVYEDDIARVRPGTPAVVKTLAYPDEPAEGKIDPAFSALDPDSRVLTVRVPLQNPGNKLKPEMFATVTVASPTGASKLSVPTSALVFERSRSYVLVFKDRNNIETRNVETAGTAGGHTYLNGGVEPGERVVSRNALLLYHTLNQ
ncbi:efflux RND transporter periplasmic adaptor subunit [Hymenobacter aerilatus]|uniref:Efflux RND transporter periplasmic adaptor subunit n=1 Tax=Hymenobacter aerilatus TaxID=2932251 RepID=A0A8T9SPL0_9BACT|nr:efflux RND transporter periplasmic adaptor subunit [Hymenobacter aerilatus]UOR03637.1 efflux RND transporter periplasmic adaptor subunit [Hymenobacter aerilatus]